MTGFSHCETCGIHRLRRRNTLQNLSFQRSCRLRQLETGGHKTSSTLLPNRVSKQAGKLSACAPASFAEALTR